ncbi:hypothetical protein M3Y97_01131500 [Aphelenchoides bicaudatus]|nr:hypothetical protein M3Y97_01131500 [Aphelenchoides bicaudatus]
MKNFTVNEVLSTSWTFLERVGTTFYSHDSLDGPHSFGYYTGNSSTELNLLRQDIMNYNSRYAYIELDQVLRDLPKFFLPNNDYLTVNYIVFISAISQDAVDVAKQYALDLGLYGQLVFIGLGNIDPQDKLLRQLTPYYIQWTDPTNDPVFNGWEQFFWSTAYGCDGSPPVSYSKPCNGRVYVLLDTSSLLTSSEFADQQTIVGQKLFSGDIFSNYERLTIGRYNDSGAHVDTFNVLTTASDVEAAVNNVTKSNDVSDLEKALYWIVNNVNQTSTDPLTTFIVCVSHVPKHEVAGATFAAQQVLSKGIRLILMAHGGDVTSSTLIQITGDPTLVFYWPTSATDYGYWLKQAMNCPQSLTNKQVS